MRTAREIRDKCDKDIADLQETCLHITSTWMDWSIGPGHNYGEVKVCGICEKILARR